MNWLNSLAIMGLLFTISENLPELSLKDLISDNGNVELKSDPPTTNVTEKVTGTYPIAADGKVSVSNVNGDISVVAWDKDQIEMEVVKSAANKEALDSLKVNVKSMPDSFELEIAYPRNNAGMNRTLQTNVKNIKADIKLKVPAGINLNGIELVNGVVRINGLTNNSRVSLVNGMLVAVNMAGSGDISTVSGSIDAEFKTINALSRITMGTVNGQIALKLPSNSSAIISANTLNGAIVNDMGLTARSSGFLGKELKGRVGSGEAQVNLSSVNGRLAVTRKADGQQPAQAEDISVDNDPDPELGKRYVEAFSGSRPAWVADGAVDLSKLNESLASLTSLQQTIATGTVTTTLAQVKELAEIEKKSSELTSKALEQARLSTQTAKLDQKMADEMARTQAAALNKFRTAWWGNGVPSIETRNKSFSVKESPSVEINCDGTDLIVRGWDKNEVKYSVTEVSENRNRMPVDVTENVEGSKLQFNFTDKNQTPKSGYITQRSNSVVEVMVPANAKVNIKTNRDIRIHNVKGNVDLEGKDNSVNIRELEGFLALKSQNSRVRVLAFKGILENKSENSEVYLDGIFNSIISGGSGNRITVTLPEEGAYKVISNNAFETEGLNATASGENVWSIGEGQTQEYRFEHENTVLLLRSMSSLRATATFNK